jgi:ATP-dependent Clp protease ATP-binding subunit ClpX
VAAAKKAIEKKTGARGLRSIFEAAMLNVMYDVPSQEGIREIVFNERAILRKEPPLIVMGETRAIRNRFVKKHFVENPMPSNLAKKN